MIKISSNGHSIAITTKNRCIIHIILGITGSIAACKTPELIRLLREQHHTVKTVLTAGGKAFVTPLTLQAISGEPVHDAFLDTAAETSMSHITLAKWADCILIAPASANFIAKLAHGFADDLLNALCLATKAPVIIAPAMNQAMWAHPATQKNIQILQHYGIQCIGPAEGKQACGDIGFGRMTEPHDIATSLFAFSKTASFFEGKSILITAGPTQEPIDPVRYISNHSSGKMGYALAQAAIDAGAHVTLISGPTALTPPPQCKFIPIITAQDMLNAVTTEIKQQTIFISTAAIADYQPTTVSHQKIKKDKNNFSLLLTPTPDILKIIKQQNPTVFCVGFAAETQEIQQHAEKKRLEKNIDMIVANDVSRKDIGFNSTHNEVTIYTQHTRFPLEKAPKLIIAKQLLQHIKEEIKTKTNQLEKTI